MRRKRSGLAQVGRNYSLSLYIHLPVEEGSAPSLRRVSQWEEAEYREREMAGSRVEQRGGVFAVSYFVCRCDLEVLQVLLEQRGWETHFLECLIRRRLEELTFLGMKQTKTSSLWLVIGAVAVMRR